MKQVSALMRDQIESPMDRAIYWIEYVIRHEGAPHLRSASRKLSLHQRGFMDVILVVLFTSFIVAYVTIQFGYRSLSFLGRNSRGIMQTNKTAVSTIKKDD